MFFKAKKKIAFLTHYNEKLYTENGKLRESNQTLNWQNKEYKQKLELIKNILDEGWIIEGVGVNRINEEVYICRMGRDDPSLLLANQRYLHSQPKILVDTEQTKPVLNTDKTIYIADFNAVDMNIGNGSILIEHIIKNAKASGYTKIRGSLSSVDKDRFDQLDHFYKKHGCQVFYNDDRTEGSIVRKLN